MQGEGVSTGGGRPDQPAKAKKGWGPIGCLIAVAALVVGVIFAVLLPSMIERAAGGKTEPTAQSLSLPLQEQIETALRAQRFPAPQSTEIASNGYLVVIFQIDNFAPRLTPQQFAEDAVVIVRNAMQGTAFDKFRVTLNGPPPGPGLIRRYGSARYSEGVPHPVSWEPAK